MYHLFEQVFIETPNKYGRNIDPIMKILASIHAGKMFILKNGNKKQNGFSFLYIKMKAIDSMPFHSENI